MSGRVAEVEEFAVDAGAGWTWADWREHRDGLLARAKYPATRRRLMQALADPPGGEHVTDRTVPWLDCAPGTYWLHMGAEGALPAQTVTVASEADDPVLMSFVDEGTWEVWAERDAVQDTAHLVSVFDHAPSIQEVRQERQRWAHRFGRPLFDFMVLTGPDWSEVEAEWMPCTLDWAAAHESPTDPVASIWEDVDQWRQQRARFDGDLSDTDENDWAASDARAAVLLRRLAAARSGR